MAYRKQEFKNYTVLTAEQLNNIEDGIVEVEKSVSKCVKTINGSAPDQNGDVKINVSESGGNVSDEQIAAAVEEYLAKNPVSGGNTVRIAEIELISANWVGDASPYSQVVNIPGVTQYSQVDLTPDVEQLAIFHDKDLSFVTENEDGVVTVYAIGDKPTNDYTMQVTIKEVKVSV